MSLRTTASYLLFPLTVWYAVGVAVRNLLFDLGIKRQQAPHITTIGIGNLCTGGSGKTPHVEYLIDMLKHKHRTAVLSRGYGRKTKGYLLDDGSHSATHLGDEPAMIAAKHPEVTVAVCEKRTEGVRRLMVEQNPDLIILDDVFQHRSIKPSVNILLTEYAHPYYTDRILPYGNLREFRTGRFRASMVIVTKCPQRLNPVDRHNIIADLKLRNYQKIFFSYFEYAPLLTLDRQIATLDLRRTDHLLAVTGIAHPEPLVEHLRQTCKTKHMAFADHHAYTRADAARIAEAFAALPGTNKAIITTEKDAVRLRPVADGLPIYIQPIRVRFHRNADEADFDTTISSAVRENISFLSKLSIWENR